MVAALRWTIRWLRERNLAVAPFDEESGCCLITRADLLVVKLRVMASSFYEPVPEDMVDAVQADIRARYFKLAKMVQDLEQSERVGSTIRRSMNCDDAWYSSKLLVTLSRTKKPPLTWRNIHASAFPAVHGLSAWVVEELKAIRLPWLLESTVEFVYCLKCWHGCEDVSRRCDGVLHEWEPADPP